MYTKEITFRDLDGNNITETFQFYLNTAELSEWSLSEHGGIAEYVKQVIKDNNNSELVRILREMIAKGVGRRSEDGRRFIKSQEITDDFMQSDAYSELFMELVSNADTAVEFFRNIVPGNLATQMDNILDVKTDGFPDEAPQSYTDQEYLEMSDEEFFKAVGTNDAMKMSKRHLGLAMQRRSRAA